MFEMTLELVSILIITRNRSFVLPDCLKPLRAQVDSAKHEVIVVDSSEDDKTEKVSKDFSWVQYHRIKLPLGTRPQAYSYGARQAKGDIVVLIDDDSIVLPGWLKALTACYEDSSVGAAGGRVLPKIGIPVPTDIGNDLVAAVLPSGRIVSNLFFDSGERLEVDVLRGCNMSVRRELLQKLNYFDPRFRGQNCRVEDDVCLGVKRMGYKVVFEPKAVVRHLAEERPDIPRSEYNARSEFYVWRNTVWLYLKHFGLRPKMLLQVAIITPAITCLRRVMGDSLKKPRVSTASLRYLPAALAGIVGGVWGVFMSLLYRLRDCWNKKSPGLPYLHFKSGLSTVAPAGSTCEHSFN